jgi:hypothetical protein
MRTDGISVIDYNIANQVSVMPGTHTISAPACSIRDYVSAGIHRTIEDPMLPIGGGIAGAIISGSVIATQPQIGIPLACGIGVAGVGAGVMTGCALKQIPPHSHIDYTSVMRDCLGGRLDQRRLINEVLLSPQD